MGTRTNRFRERVTTALKRAASRQALRGELASQTTPDDLRSRVREYSRGRRVIIASNREPYQHVRDDGGIRVIRSPGGLASALDSVARATGATWVAQASGDADQEAADAAGRVAVPPGVEDYTLQRLWVNPEETANDFRRFTNGCLWPLCHVVYVRPHFVASQWKAYRDVNAQFADAILAAAGNDPALVLLQDFHLACCAPILRKKRPDLSIVMFWHIPWPNPEAFRILPWRRDVLEGLLACDLLGFHINYHGMNFIDTVALELEARVDRERSAILRRGHRTFVRAYPIGPDAAEISMAASDPSTIRAAQDIREALGIGDARVILGVDRLDYTKGIPERLAAYELFLETHPSEAGRVAFVQIGVPSRVDLPEYQALGASVEESVQRLNRRFGGARGPIIHLITRNLDFRELIPYYVLADVLAVTALHDGMNLVAKEYVAAKVNLDGVLILSPYTGAARELEHALQVSPYDAELMAGVIGRALAMPPTERAERMRALREVVASRNIYDWASKIFRDVRRLHIGPSRSGAMPRH
ncbi:MAG: alpha,alpha-trehalose-phosphate synthase (UDP-forming) [Candidatus Eiseniibacteriota bacterium]